MAKSDDYWIHDESYRRFFCCQGVSATSDRFTAASRWGNLHVAAPRAGLPRQRLFNSRRKPAIRYYSRPQPLRLHFRKIPVAPSFAKTGFYSEKLPGRL